MSDLLLTIDDTPSGQTDALTDYLAARGVPAILFCRGDLMEANPEPVVRAIKKGFIIANHAWSHTRFSQLSYEQGVDEILRTEALIEDAYKKAGVARTAKYFRFPHMDRGTAGWIVDYDAAPAHRGTLTRFFQDGLNIDLTPPSAELVEKKNKWQEFLKAQGFAPLPSSCITLPWYKDTEMAQAVDAMFTYSTSDWMVTERHKGKWPYKDIAALRKKIDDEVLPRDGAHIVLAHDQDELLPVVQALVDHMLQKKMTFRKPEEFTCPKPSFA